MLMSAADLVAAALFAYHPVQHAVLLADVHDVLAYKQLVALGVKLLTVKVELCCLTFIYVVLEATATAGLVHAQPY